MTGSTPQKGTVAEPGLALMAPGSGVIKIDPVSVCRVEREKNEREREKKREKHDEPEFKT